MMVYGGYKGITAEFEEIRRARKWKYSRYDVNFQNLLTYHKTLKAPDNEETKILLDFLANVFNLFIENKICKDPNNTQYHRNFAAHNAIIHKVNHEDFIRVLYKGGKANSEKGLSLSKKKAAEMKEFLSA